MTARGGCPPLRELTEEWQGEEGAWHDGRMAECDWGGENDGAGAFIQFIQLIQFLKPSHLHGFQNLLAAALWVVIKAGQVQYPLPQVSKQNAYGIDIWIGLTECNSNVIDIRPLHLYFPFAFSWYLALDISAWY